MPLSLIQENIIDELRIDKRTVKQLAESLDRSVGYIRNQVAHLETAHHIRRVDNRQPLQFELIPQAEQNPKLLAMVDKLRKQLLTKDTKAMPFVKALHELPKSEWHHAILPYEAMVYLLKDMKDNGELIDTL